METENYTDENFSVPCCDCHEAFYTEVVNVQQLRILELEELVSSLKIKLTVAKTTGERLTHLTEILQGEANRLNR